MSGRRFFIGQTIAICGLVGLYLVSCRKVKNDNTLINPTNNSQSKQEVKTMKLESSAFDANGLIPAKYTCDGENISPAIIWDEIPRGTQSIALIVDDPDAPGQTFVHWVVYSA